jgi:DNA-directed RNA polymerase specialized sigma24 family protein
MTPPQSAVQDWAEDTTDWLTWTGFDWEAARNVLVGQFGEDLAHFALWKLLRAQQQGKDIEDPVAWCRTVAKHQQWREERQARRHVSMTPWESGETEPVPEGLMDLVTPERRIIARDLLARAHPCLIAQLFGDETTISARMRCHWRGKLRVLAGE